jgi:polysaccharide export outer membrane protein
MSGQAPDAPLRAEDVLFVPNNNAKSAGMKTLDILVQTATGMAIYGRY